MKNTLKVLLMGAMIAFSGLASTQASAGITAPANASTLNGTNVTFSWANSGATAYWLMIGSTVGGSGYYNSGSLAANVFSATVAGLPVKGVPIHARLYEMINGAWQITDYSYNASSVPVATIQNLVNGGVITVANKTITWNDVGADAYYLMLGSYLGGNDILNTGTLAAGTTSALVVNLPNDKSTVYARLYTWGNGIWQSSDTTYTVTYGVAINNLVNGSTLGATVLTVSWPTATNVGGYYLDVGSNFNGHGDYFKSGILSTATSSVVVTGLPTGSVPVYFRLYTWVNNGWQVSDTVYTSAP